MLFIQYFSSNRFIIIRQVRGVRGFETNGGEAANRCPGRKSLANKTFLELISFSAVRRMRHTSPRPKQDGRIFRFCCCGVRQNWKIAPRPGRAGRIFRFCCNAIRHNRKILPAPECGWRVRGAMHGLLASSGSEPHPRDASHRSDTIAPKARWKRASAFGLSA